MSWGLADSSPPCPIDGSKSSTLETLSVGRQGCDCEVKTEDGGMLVYLRKRILTARMAGEPQSALNKLVALSNH